MNTAHGEPSGAMRRVRLRVPVNHNLVVVPALVGVGMALGWAFIHAGGGTGERVADQSVAAGDAARLPMPVHLAEARNDPAPLQAPAEHVAEGSAPPAVTAAASGPRQDPNSEPHDASVAATELPVYDESSVTLAEVHKLPAEVSGATDVDVRASALRQAEGADSLQLLEQTLRTDTTARNRLLAVNSLRQLGKQAENTERVRSALRAAMSDADANVATNARDAYQELSR